MSNCSIVHRVQHNLVSRLENASDYEEALSIILEEANLLNGNELLYLTQDLVIGAIEAARGVNQELEEEDWSDLIEDFLKNFNKLTSSSAQVVTDKEAISNFKRSEKLFPLLPADCQPRATFAIKKDFLSIGIYDFDNNIITIQNGINYNVKQLRNRYFKDIIDYFGLNNNYIAQAGNLLYIQSNEGERVNGFYQTVMEEAFDMIMDMDERTKRDARAIKAITAFYALNNFDDFVTNFAGENFVIQDNSLYNSLFVSNQKYKLKEHKFAIQDFDEAKNDAHKNSDKLYESLMFSIQYGDNELILAKDLNRIRDLIMNAVNRHDDVNVLVDDNTYVQYNIAEVLNPENFYRFDEVTRVKVMLAVLNGQSDPAIRAFVNFWNGDGLNKGYLDALNFFRSMSSLRTIDSVYKMDFSQKTNLAQAFYYDIFTHYQNFLVNNNKGKILVSYAHNAEENRSILRLKIINTIKKNVDAGRMEFYNPDRMYTYRRNINDVLEFNSEFIDLIYNAFGIPLYGYERMEQIKSLPNFVKGACEFAKIIKAKQLKFTDLASELDTFMNKEENAYFKQAYASIMKDVITREEGILEVVEKNLSGNAQSKFKTPNMSARIGELVQNFQNIHTKFIGVNETGNPVSVSNYNVMTNEHASEFRGKDNDKLGYMAVRSETLVGKKEVVDNKGMTDSELIQQSLNDEFLNSLLLNNFALFQPVCASDKSTTPLNILRARGENCLMYLSIEQLKKANFDQFRYYHIEQAILYCKSWCQILLLASKYDGVNITNTQSLQEGLDLILNGTPDNSTLSSLIRVIIEESNNIDDYWIRKAANDVFKADKTFQFSSGLHYNNFKGKFNVPNMSVIRNFLIALDDSGTLYGIMMDDALQRSYEQTKDVFFSVNNKNYDVNKIKLLVGDTVWQQLIAGSLDYRGTINSLFTREIDQETLQDYQTRANAGDEQAKADLNYILITNQKRAILKKALIEKHFYLSLLCKEATQQIIQKDFSFHKGGDALKEINKINAKEDASYVPMSYLQAYDAWSNPIVFKLNLEYFLKEDMARYETSTKRNNALTASFSQELGSTEAVDANGNKLGYCDYRVAPSFKVAVMPAFKQLFMDFSGHDNYQSPHDGGAWTLGIHAILENLSSFGKDVTGSKKNIGILIFEQVEMIFKYADFELSNDLLRMTSEGSHTDKEGINLVYLAKRMMHECRIPLENIQKRISEFNRSFNPGYWIYQDGEYKQYKRIELDGTTLNFVYAGVDGTETIKPVTVEDGGFYLDQLWEAAGAQYTFDFNGDTSGNEASNVFMAVLLCEIYPQGREEYVAKIIPDDAIKQAHTNINSMPVYFQNGVLIDPFDKKDGHKYSDDELVARGITKKSIWSLTPEEFSAVGLQTVNCRSAYIGMQNDNTHAAEEGTVANPTQFFSALSHGGKLEKLAQTVYETMEAITLRQLEYDKFNIKDQNAVINLVKEMYSGLVSGIDVAGAEDILSYGLQKLVQDGDLEYKLPISEIGLFKTFSRSIIANCNKEIRGRFAGQQAIMNPSDNLVKIFDSIDKRSFLARDLFRIAKDSNVKHSTPQEAIQFTLDNNAEFQNKQITNCQELQLEDTVEFTLKEGTKYKSLIQLLSDNKFKWGKYCNQRFLIKTENGFRMCLKDPANLYFIEEISPFVDIQLTFKFGRDLKTTNVNWEENGVVHNLWFEDAVKNRVLVKYEGRESNLDDIINLKFLYDCLQNGYIVRNGVRVPVQNFNYLTGEQVITKSFAKKHMLGNLSLQEVLEQGPKRYADQYSHSYNYKKEILQLIIAQDTAEEKKNAVIAVRSSEDGDIVFTDASSFRIYNDFNNPNYRFVNYVRNPQVNSKGLNVFKDNNGVVLCEGISDDSQMLVYFDSNAHRYVYVIQVADRLLNGEVIKASEDVLMNNVFKSTKANCFIALNSNPNQFTKATENNGKSTAIPQELQNVDRDENFDELQKIMDMRTSELAQQVFESFKVTLNVLSVRTPTQSWQSGIPLKTVAFIESPYNDVYVNKWEQFFQGSDYDIDKAVTLMYNIDKRGVINQFSPLADFSSEQSILDSLEYLPLPKKGNTIRVFDFNADPKNGIRLNDVLSDNNIDINNISVKEYGFILDLINEAYKRGKNIYLVSDNTNIQSINNIAQNINRHQQYDSSIEGMQNKVVRLMQKAATSMASLYRQQTPMDSSPVTDKLTSKKKIKNPNSTGTTMEMQHQSTTGKTQVGIMASAQKGASAILHFYTQNANGSLQAPIDPSIRSFNINLSEINSNGSIIRGRVVDRIASSPFSTANLDAIIERAKAGALGESMRIKMNLTQDVEIQRNYVRAYLDSTDTDLVDVLSIMISLAADNAKELALDKLNCTEDTAKGIVAMLYLNYSIDEIVAITNGVMGDIRRKIENNRLDANSRKVSINNAIQELVEEGTFSEETGQALTTIFEVGAELTNFAIKLGLNQGVSVDLAEMNQKLYGPLNAVLNKAGKKLKNSDGEDIKAKNNRIIKRLESLLIKIYGPDFVGNVISNNTWEYYKNIVFGDFSFDKFYNNYKYDATDKLGYADMLILLNESVKVMINDFDIMYNNHIYKAMYLSVENASMTLSDNSASYQLNKAALNNGYQISQDNGLQAIKFLAMMDFFDASGNSRGRYLFNADTFRGGMEYYGFETSALNPFAKTITFANELGLTLLKNTVEQLIYQLLSENNGYNKYLSKLRNVGHSYKFMYNNLNDNRSNSDADVINSFRELCGRQTMFRNIKGQYLTVGELLYLYDTLFGSDGNNSLQSKLRKTLRDCMPNSIATGLSVVDAIDQQYGALDEEITNGMKTVVDPETKQIVHSNPQVAEKVNNIVERIYAYELQNYTKKSKSRSKNNNEQQQKRDDAIREGYKQSTEGMLSPIFMKRTEALDITDFDKQKTEITNFLKSVLARNGYNIDDFNFDNIIQCE